MSSRPVLRPLDFGGIFDQAFKLYTGNWRTLLKISAVVMIPLGAISLIVSLVVFSDLETSLTDPDAFVNAPEEAFAALLAAMVPLFIVGLLNLVALWLIQGACTHAVSEIYAGREPEWQASLREGLRRLPSYLGAMILMGLGVLAGMFLFLVGGLWIAIMWTVAIPALIAEDLRPMAALQRSWQLISGSWWRTFGLMVVSSLIVGIISVALASPTQVMIFTGGSLTAAQATSQVASTISYTLTLPFQALVAVVIYFDLRVRKEAFDLQALAASMGDPSIAPAPPAPPTPPASPPFGDADPQPWEDPGSPPDPFA